MKQRLCDIVSACGPIVAARRSKRHADMDLIVLFNGSQTFNMYEGTNGMYEAIDVRTVEEPIALIPDALHTGAEWLLEYDECAR